MMTIFFIIMAFAYGLVIGHGFGWKSGWNKHKKLEDEFRPLEEQRIRLDERLRQFKQY